MHGDEASNRPEADARISLLVPSRGRPALLRRFLDSVLARAARPDLVEVVVYADDDDPQSHGLELRGLEVQTLVGPRTTMGRCNTACLDRSRGDIVVLGNDDVVIRTHAWDGILRRLHNSVPDGVYLAYPNDLFKGRSLCAFPILSRSTCGLLAEPFPAAYHGAFIDYHLLDIFRRLEHRGLARLIYLEEVIFEHLHYRTGKADFDATYRGRDRFRDDVTFLALRGDRSAEAARLIAAIEGQSAARPEPSPAATERAEWPLLHATLLDRELPLSWRVRLFSWLVARGLASRVSEGRK